MEDLYHNHKAQGEPIFYYHSDHLGSASYITDDHGNETQHLVYLPFLSCGIFCRAGFAIPHYVIIRICNPEDLQY